MAGVATQEPEVVLFNFFPDAGSQDKGKWPQVRENFFPKIWHYDSLTEQGCSPHSWRHLKDTWMWYLGTGFSGCLGSWVDSWTPSPWRAFPS